MRIEEIREAVEVIALFRTGHVMPLKFRWREKIYRVNSINGGWQSEQGAVRFHHFAVMSEGSDIFELCYNERTHNWKLEKVSLEA
jgi:hypothetical protein